MFLHSDDIAELGAPILAGDEIRASARYVDAYLREGKRGPMLFQTAEMKLTNQADAHVATVRVSAVSL
jgi:acyl dehydratase